MILEYLDFTGMTQTERQSIENSVSTIASTPYAGAPFLRNMGIVDYPPKDVSDVARNRYATEVMTQCDIWEDRVKVSNVTFTDSNDVRILLNG